MIPEKTTTLVAQRRRTPSRRYGRFMGLVALISLGTILLFIRFSDLDVLIGVTAAFLVGLGLYFLIRYYLTRSFDVLEPIYIISGLLIVGYLGGLAYNALAFGSFTSIEGKTYLITALSLACFAGGYCFPLGARIASILPVGKLLKRYPRQNAVPLLLAIWAGTVLFRIRYMLGLGYGSAIISPDRRGPLDNIIISIGSFGYLLLFMATVIVARRGRSRLKNLLVLGSCYAVDSALLMIGGWKIGLFILPIGLLIFFRSLPLPLRPSPWKTFVVFAAIIPIIALSFRAITDYRRATAGNEPGYELLIQSFRGGRDNTLAERVGQLYQRISYGPMLSRVIEAVDRHEIDMRMGGSLWPGFVWFIPRGLWPGKPPLSIGGWYAMEVLGWTGDGRSEAAVTLPGDFYLNFGLIGVAAGMLLFGFMARLLYAYFVLRLDYPVGLFLFVPIFLGCLVGFERNFATIFAQVMQQGIMIFVVSMGITRAVNPIKSKSERTS